VLTYGKPREVTLTLDGRLAQEGCEASFVISAVNKAGGKENYCSGRIAAATKDPEPFSPPTELIRDEAKLEVGRYYAELRKRGLEYGANFATIRELWLGQLGSGEAIGRITLSPFEDEADPHPYNNAVLLDGCLQVFGAALRTFGENERSAFVPVSIQSITLRDQLPFRVRSHVSVRTGAGGRAAVAHFHILSDGGEVLAEIDGLELREKASLATGQDDRGAARVRPAGEGGSGHSVSREQLIEQLRGKPKPERVKVVTGWLASEVKDVLGQRAEDMDLDNVDPSLAFLEIGLDSLLVTELQRRLQEKLDFRFQPMQGLDYQSIESLAGYIHDEVLKVEPAEHAAGEPATNGSVVAAKDGTSEPATNGTGEPAKDGTGEPVKDGTGEPAKDAADPVSPAVLVDADSQSV
jgi:acyl carrier protein